MKTIIKCHFLPTVLDEIEDRRQFLEEMMTLGKGHQYEHLINTEISQVKIQIHKLITANTIMKRHQPSSVFFLKESHQQFQSKNLRN